MGSDFTWDTTSVPDGTYSVKIVASDAVEPSGHRTDRGSRERGVSDRQQPAGDRGEGRSYEGGRQTTRFVARDQQSPVQRVEYSTDATTWRVIYPVDGLADSREETFALTVEGAPKEIIVRVTDALSNVATAVVASPPR